MMKKLFVLLLLFSGCAADTQKAKSTVEGFLDALKNSDFVSADGFYSNEQSLDGSKENRIAKMQQLESALGPVVSYEFKSDSILSTAGEPAKVMLIYDVTHTRLITREKYIVTNEGEYRITSQLVENRH